MSSEQILTGFNNKNVAATWDDAHRYTPAPRHRRRLLFRIIDGLHFKDCLDTGCAQPYLLQEIVHRYSVAGYGCDISDQVIASNKEQAPDCQFLILDLSREVWPKGKQFDLVISSEVLEHIPDWRSALKNMVDMSRKYLLITVPSGKVRTMDRKVGHYRHFYGPELTSSLQEFGCTVLKVRRWGFPVHSLYKVLISKIAPDKIYDSFAGGRSYSLLQRLLSHILYLLFYLNEFWDSGDQLIVLAQCTPKGDSHSENGDAEGNNVSAY